MRRKDKNIFYSLEDELEIKIKRKSTLSDWFENFKLYSNPYANYIQYGWANATQAVRVEQPYTATDGSYSNLTYATTDGLSYMAQPVYYTTGTRTYYGN